MGELLIVTMYGFPVQALPIISMIGTLVDPPATMVNATGNNICRMLVARILGGKTGRIPQNRAYFAYMIKYLNLRANIALGLIFAFLLNTFGPIPAVQAPRVSFACTRRHGAAFKPSI